MSLPDLANGHKFLYIALRVSNIEKSAAFFSGLFDMKIVYHREMDTATPVFLEHSDPAVPDRPLTSREGVLDLLTTRIRIPTIFILRLDTGIARKIPNKVLCSGPPV
ncbi:hypothetical protein FOC4_g10001360 [Fusarium odoratissimum]|uniref:Uncharacterized protein n=2 Tax=Fusarium oxysporum species complex TaxID=171631 RepID=N1S9Z7_FUSC4|nr:hypothetical protein FOC4_g10001360 [Fusarium odoratissimum]TXC12254.1 hypothetical protein FocTR4_00007586 [Fusarium oxysporum f. sp. cubense]